MASSLPHFYYTMMYVFKIMTLQWYSVLFGDEFNEPPEVVIGIGQFLFHQQGTGKPNPLGALRKTHIGSHVFL